MSNHQKTENPTGAGKKAGLRMVFDSRLKLEFQGSKITSDAGLLAYRELDAALGLTVLGGNLLSDGRTGKNTQHSMVAQMRQSIFSRLAGYEDTNDAERLAVDPTMRQDGGGCGAARVVPDDFGTDWTAEICNCDVRMSKSERNHMKTTATTEAVSSSPGENGHWNTKWRRTTSRAGKKQVAD